MDRQGIATAMLSVSSPGVHFGDDDTARALARSVNEFAARNAPDHRGRFGTFTSLPLPNIDAALAEIAYALAVLKVNGFVMLTNYGFGESVDIVILTSGITCILALIIVPTIPESGHAAACIIQGGAVTHWKRCLSEAKQKRAVAPALPVLVRRGLVRQHRRLVCTYVYSRHATRLGTGRLWTVAAMLWFWWSVWVFGEIFMDALHACSDVPLHHDNWLLGPPDRNQSG
jgi:hypothetical protein